MPEIYRSPHTGSIADLIGKRGTAGARALQTAGDAQAQRVMASGQAWGQAGQNIAQGVSGTLADFARQKEEAPRRELQQRQSDLLAKQLSELETGMAQQKIGELASMIKASNYDPATAEPIFGAIAKLSPEYAEPLQRALMDPQQLKGVTDLLITQVPGYKAPDGFSLSPGQKRFDAQGNEIASAPEQPEGFTLGEGQQRFDASGQPIASGPQKPPPATPNPTEASLALLAAQGNQQAAQALAKLRAMRAPQGTPAVRQPIWVVGADGEFQDLAGVAPPGSKPANSREQGRAVVTGDANRIADLDTSLDDLSTLSTTLSETKDATGTQAQIGAALWQPITNLTGWGVDAKKRQGVIDRVKQVIGKALEGGVLRKEDEAKYAKILPTIADDPEVAASKLEGLRQALVQRRQTLLDALGDAGYDVSRFAARTDRTGLVTMIAPDGTEKQVSADQVDHYKSLGARVKE